MKTIRFTAVMLACMATSAFAQTPGNIESAVKSKYPDATVKKVKYENSRYQATFTSQGKKEMAYFDKNGNWLQTNIDSKWNAIPESVKAGFIRSKYRRWMIENVQQVETPDGTFYSVEVDNQYVLDGDESYGLAQDCYVYFNPSGSFVKEVRM